MSSTTPTFSSTLSSTFRKRKLNSAGDFPNHISIVTWIEVMAGAPPHRAETTLTFLSGFTIIPLTPEIAERAATLRQQTRLKLPDALILATAQQNHRTLVTRNTRDFAAAHPDIHIPYTM